MKKTIIFMALGIVLSATGLKAADILTLGNANFETVWTNLTDYGTPTVILKKTTTIASDVTGWTGDVGNGNLTIYQGAGHTGNNSAVLINTSATSGCRFYNNSVMTLTKGGQYKLTFYARGSAKLGNVCLYESATRPSIALATSGGAGGVYDVSKTTNNPVSFGDTWTKQEYNFTVPIGSSFTNYKLYFTFYGCTAPLADGSNLSSAFMIDDITFEPSVDNTVCTLTGITVGGKAISNFNANTLSYSVLANNQTIPAVAGTTTDPSATTIVSSPVIVGNTSTVTIGVTAADAVTKKTYTVVFTITNDVIIEGFSSDVVPIGWTMSQTMSGGDWLIDTGSSYNNGLYIGVNSLRIKGGGGTNPSLTSGWLMIPNVELPNAMTFYLKTRDVATCTLSVYKRPTSVNPFTDLTGWTLCGTFTAPYDAAFTQKQVAINSTVNTDILLYVEKDDTKIPFALDDIRLTKLSTDYFRSVTSGNWESTSTWESSANGTTNWLASTAIPLSASASAVIMSGNTVTVTSSFMLPNLTINSGSVLNINAGKQLTVNSTLTNNGTLNLKSDNTGAIATILAPSTIAAGGTYNVEQYLSSARNWYISSPLSNAKAPAGFTYSSRNEAAANWTTINEGADLIAGTGYIALPTVASIITFSTTTGTLNVGDVDISLTWAGAANKGFNLIGNPYPSHLTWTKAFTDANVSLIEPTIWYRTNAGTVNNSGQWSFLTYNTLSGQFSPLGTTNIIPPMQAFWVRAKSAGTLTLNNTLIHSHETSNPLKAPALKKADYQKLRLQVSNSTITDELLIYSDAKASNEYDAYDSPKMSNNNVTIPEIYTVAGNERLVINGMNTFSVDVEIPVGFVTGQSNTFSIKANEFSNFDPDVKVILKDKVANKEFDLTDGSIYTFNSDITSTINRFSVVLKSKGSTTRINGTNNESILVYRNNKQIRVDCGGSSFIGGQIKIYNAIGQKLAEQQIVSLNTEINGNFDSGVVLVNINNGKESITRKLSFVKQ